MLKNAILRYLLALAPVLLFTAHAQQPDPETAALEAAGGKAIGGTVTMLGVLGGAELDAFLAVIEPFEAATGIDVVYESTRDLGAVLQTRVDGGNPPDLVSTPAIGQMSDFSAAGQLLDLSEVLDVEQVIEDFGEGLVNVTSRDGQLFGIFDAINLGGLVWYNPNAYTGPNPAANWEDLKGWMNETAAGGETPWCIGLESGPASGWPGANLITELLLRQFGPEVHERWWQGDLAWSSPEVRTAFATYGELVTSEMVNGGATAALATGFANGADGLFAEPPTCYLHNQANFMGSMITANFPELAPIDDVSFFPLPDLNDQYPSIRPVSGEIVGVFTDTPQARALITYLAGPAAQTLIAKTNIWLSPSSRVSPDAYASPFTRLAAEVLASGEAHYYGNALMPQAMSDAFWSAVLDYTQDPDNLDAILAELDEVRAESY